MNYYEIDFDMEYSICIKGEKEPSITEAEEFCKNDMIRFGVEHVKAVVPITYDEACRFYDMSNEKNWPIFGQ